MQTTAATPTMMPSTVSTLRILLARKACNPMIKLSESSFASLRRNKPKYRSLLRAYITINHAAVVQADATVRAFCDLAIVRNHHDRTTVPVKIREQPQDFIASIAIKCSRGLVRQENSGLVH